MELAMDGLVRPFTTVVSGLEATRALKVTPLS